MSNVFEYIFNISGNYSAKITGLNKATGEFATKVRRLEESVRKMTEGLRLCEASLAKYLFEISYNETCYSGAMGEMIYKIYHLCPTINIGRDDKTAWYYLLNSESPLYRFADESVVEVIERLTSREREEIRIENWGMAGTVIGRYLGELIRAVAEESEIGGELIKTIAHGERVEMQDEQKYVEQIAELLRKEKLQRDWIENIQKRMAEEIRMNLPKDNITGEFTERIIRYIAEKPERKTARNGLHSASLRGLIELCREATQPAAKNVEIGVKRLREAVGNAVARKVGTEAPEHTAEVGNHLGGSSKMPKVWSVALEKTVRRSERAHISTERKRNREMELQKERGNIQIMKGINGSERYVSEAELPRRVEETLLEILERAADD